MSIQPAGAGTEVTCPSCGHQDGYPGDASLEVIHCDQCRARLAFGQLAPQWTNLPTEDPRFLLMKIGDVTVKVDRAFARMIALDILSVCPEPAATQQELPLWALDPVQPEFWQHVGYASRPSHAATLAEGESCVYETTRDDPARSE